MEFQKKTGTVDKYSLNGKTGHQRRLRKLQNIPESFASHSTYMARGVGDWGEKERSLKKGEAADISWVVSKSFQKAFSFPSSPS